MRRILLISAVLLIAYIASTVAIRYIRYATTPEWKRELVWSTSRPMPPVEAGSPLTKWVNDLNYLWQDLVIADEWGGKELEEIRQFTNIPPIRDEQVTTSSEFDERLLDLWDVKEEALSIIAERIRVDAPIDEEYRQELIDMLTAGLYQNESFLSFSFAAPRVIHSGLADTQGPIRDRLLYIYEHPKEFFGNDGLSVAENIKRQLKGRGTFRLEGETHEG